MKQSIDYNILYFRHVVFGVAGTESCYMKQSIDYNNTDWNHPEVNMKQNARILFIWFKIS